MIIFRKYEKIKLQKIAKDGVLKIFLTNPLTLETMQQLIIKHWRKSLEFVIIKS